jgi:hypothetical protein
LNSSYVRDNHPHRRATHREKNDVRILFCLLSLSFLSFISIPFTSSHLFCLQFLIFLKLTFSNLVFYFSFFLVSFLTKNILSKKMFCSIHNTYQKPMFFSGLYSFWYSLSLFSHTHIYTHYHSDILSNKHALNLFPSLKNILSLTLQLTHGGLEGVMLIIDSEHLPAPVTFMWVLKYCLSVNKHKSKQLLLLLPSLNVRSTFPNRNSNSKPIN